VLASGATHFPNFWKEIALSQTPTRFQGNNGDQFFIFDAVGDCS
jgi:hypothetical protein